MYDGFWSLIGMVCIMGFVCLDFVCLSLVKVSTYIVALHFAQSH